MLAIENGNGNFDGSWYFAFLLFDFREFFKKIHQTKKIFFGHTLTPYRRECQLAQIAGIKMISPIKQHLAVFNRTFIRINKLEFIVHFFQRIENFLVFPLEYVAFLGVIVKINEKPFAENRKA